MTIPALTLPDGKNSARLNFHLHFTHPIYDNSLSRSFPYVLFVNLSFSFYRTYRENWPQQWRSKGACSESWSNYTESRCVRFFVLTSLEPHIFQHVIYFSTYFPLTSLLNLFSTPHLIGRKDNRGQD